MIIKQQYTQQGGYMALVAVLIVMTSVMTISVVMALNGVSELRLSQFEHKSVQAFYAADGCMNEGLLRLKEDGNSGYTTYTGSSVTIDGAITCTINVNSTGSTRILIASGTVDNIITRSIQAEVDISAGFSLDSWKEIAE